MRVNPSCLIVTINKLDKRSFAVALRASRSGGAYGHAGPRNNLTVRASVARPGIPPDIVRFRDKRRSTVRTRFTRFNAKLKRYSVWYPSSNVDRRSGPAIHSVLD